MLDVEVRGAASPKESMTYAGLGIEAGIGASKLGLELRGLGLSFGAGIGALRLRLELWGLDWSLAAGIEALGMGLGS